MQPTVCADSDDWAARCSVDRAALCGDYGGANVTDCVAFYNDVRVADFSAARVGNFSGGNSASSSADRE